jgi:hypothetical protein
METATTTQPTHEELVAFCQRMCDFHTKKMLYWMRDLEDYVNTGGHDSGLIEHKGALSFYHRDEAIAYKERGGL